MAGGITAAVIGGAAVLGGAYMASQGAQNAASTQANAALQQQGNLLAAGNQASQAFAPYASYGATPLASLTANNPYFNQQFSNADLNAQLAPNYAFMLGQGQQANLMSNNATGGIGGNAQTALQQYTQNYASNAYQNAFNNFQTQRGNISAIDLANANLGLAGTTGQANAQLGTATNIANLGIGAANATAASQIAQGNIYGGAANTLGSMGYGYATQANANNALQSTLLNNMGGYNANQIAEGATPGGAFTPTAGNSFTLTPA
jgi:hypothetical protein